MIKHAVLMINLRTNPSLKSTSKVALIGMHQELLVGMMQGMD